MAPLFVSNNTKVLVKAIVAAVALVAHTMIEEQKESTIHSYKLPKFHGKHRKWRDWNMAPKWSL
jgi:hypothetical protein